MISGFSWANSAADENWSSFCQCSSVGCWTELREKSLLFYSFSLVNCMKYSGILTVLSIGVRSLKLRSWIFQIVKKKRLKQDGNTLPQSRASASIGYGMLMRSNNAEAVVHGCAHVYGDGNTTTLLQKGSTLLKPFCKYCFYFQLKYIWVDCLTLNIISISNQIKRFSVIRAFSYIEQVSYFNPSFWRWWEM